jgi:hypothetical protein
MEKGRRGWEEVCQLKCFPIRTWQFPRRFIGMYLCLEKIPGSPRFRLRSLGTWETAETNSVGKRLE